MKNNSMRNRWLRGAATLVGVLGLLLFTQHPALAGKPVPPPSPPPPIADQAIVYNMGADIWIMNTDGSGDRLVLAGAGGQSTSIKPRWSPDDNVNPAHRQILFAGNPPTSAGGVGAGIYTVYLDGSNLRQITPTSSYADPDWSPVPLPGTGALDESGQPTAADWILYFDSGPTGPDGSRSWDIFAVRLDGVIRINLTNTWDITEAHPIWSTGADRFAAFVYDGDGSLATQTINNVVVYTVDVVNGLPQISTNPSPQITPASNSGRCVDWARTQDKVLYIPGGSGWELRNVAAVSGEIQLITAPVYDAGISPDDTRIAYQEFQGNIYLADANGANRVLIKSLTSGKKNSAIPLVSLDWRRY